MKVKLSSMTREIGKPQVKRRLFEMFRDFTKMVKVKNVMTEKELIRLTNMFYKEYFWMSAKQIFEFFEWVLAGKGGELYQTLDIPKFFQLLASYQTNLTFSEPEPTFEDEEEPKLLNEGKPKKSFEPDFAGLAKRLEAKRAKQQAKILLYGPKYVNFEGFCQFHGIDQRKLFCYFAKIYGAQFDQLDGATSPQFSTEEIKKARHGYIKNQCNRWAKDMRKLEIDLIKNPIT
jgi:hypothetical protein